MPTKRILVLGEAGDGKSTMINGLKHQSERSAPTGRAARGITKTVEVYRGIDLANGETLELFDTPGAGDADVSFFRMIQDVVQKYGSIFHGVIVTNPIPDGRVRLGAQIVQSLVQHGFKTVSGSSWKSVIVCGTKLDRAEAGDTQCFQEQIVPAFFAGVALQDRGQHVMVSKQNYSPLLRAIERLPSGQVGFDADTLSGAAAVPLAMQVSPSLSRELEEAKETHRQQQQQILHIQRRQQEQERRYRQEMAVRDAEEARLMRRLQGGGDPSLEVLQMVHVSAGTTVVLTVVSLQF